MRSAVVKSLLLIAALAAMPCSGAASAEKIPALEGKTLSGRPVRLPADLGSAPAIVIIGFSKSSSTQGRKWGEAVAKELDCRERPLQWFELPVLDEVPKLLRPVVLRAIRAGLAPETRQHFVPVVSDVDAWKRAVSYSEPNDVYVMVVEPGGQIARVMHGDFSIARLQQVKKHVEESCHAL